MDSRLRARRALLLLPGAFAAHLLRAQIPGQTHPPPGEPDENNPDIRLPNGRKQRDEILKADYEKDIKDARDLIDLAKSFEESLEKDDRFVLSLTSLKKLDEMDKLIRRIRGRLKH